MATFNRVSALVLTAFLLFAAANLSAAQRAIVGLTVNGRLCCTHTGNCPNINGTGVPATPVHLDCNVDGTYVPVGQNKTKQTGSFSITVLSTRSESFERAIIPCVVRVQVPVCNATKCTALSETAPGTLVSGIKSTDLEIVGSSGLIRIATLTGFVKRKGDS